MPKFSVIFPTYKIIGTIPTNVKKLYLNYKDVEFIIAARDVPDEMLSVLKRLKEDYPIRIITELPEEGKTGAVNEAIRHASGEYFLFFDNDVEILNENLLRDIEEALRRGDFGSGMIYLLGDTWTQRGARIDYLAINSAIYLQEKFGTSFGVNGAFIFAKADVVHRLGGFRHVITEDSDFGSRASEEGFRPVFLNKECIATDAPGNWLSWYRQRVRWAIGGAQTGALHAKFYLKRIPELLAQVTAVFPYWVVQLLLLVWPGPLAFKLLWLLFSTLSMLHYAFLVLAYVSFMAMFLSELPAALLGVVLYVIWVEFWRRKLKFPNIRWTDVVFYIFVYGPLWGSLLVGALIYIALRGPNVKEVAGWKA